MIERKNYRVDPRTKLLMLLLINVFVTGGLGGHVQWMEEYRVVLTLIPLFLLILHKKQLIAFFYGVLYIGLLLAQSYFSNDVNGSVNILLLFFSGLIVRLVPSVIAGYCLLLTTTVSEFVTGLDKLRLSETIVIPLSVIFRFFPSVVDEARSILTCMKLKGIRLGRENIIKTVEYFIIPLISALNRIGEELMVSASTKGFGAPIKRSNTCAIGFNLIDYVIWMIVLVPVFFIIGETL